MSIEHNTDREIKVSVVMPVYNAGEYLSRAIGDVLGQSLSDIELILVDDGSTDNSAEIIDNFKARDERVSAIRQSNSGPSVARNKGLEIATGKYVIFLDADDLYEPNYLEALYSLAEQHSLDVAIGSFDIYDESHNKFTPAAEDAYSVIFDDGKVTSKNEHPESILGSASGYVWNKLLLASFLRDKKIAFDPDLYVFEDVHFSCSVMALAERAARVDGILLHHRVYSDQSRATLFRKYYGQVPVVYQKIKEFLMQRGMYIPLKKGYLNFSAGRCYKIYNLLWAGGKERMWDMLHYKYSAELDWLNNDKADFDSNEVYEFVSNTALYGYGEYIERLEMGKNIDVGQLDKEQMAKKVIKKQKGEFRRAAWNKLMRIFKIKKK